MEKSKNAEESITCPFCGAPQRDVIPPNVAQVKCGYCGGMFSVPPSLGDTVPRCRNHPEAFATGLCNDCNGHFCARCLYTYDLRTNSASARLYLCSNCLRERHLKQANGYILFGIILLFLELFVIVVPIRGILVTGTLLVLLLSIPCIVYGLYKRSTLMEASTVYDKRETILTRKAEVSEMAQDVDTDALYGKMLSEYATRCSIFNAKNLLDNEIRAYVRHGLDYEEAVLKVAQAKGIITAESRARSKAKVEDEIVKEDKPKKIRKSKMVR